MRDEFGKAEAAAKAEGGVPMAKWLDEVFPEKVSAVEKSLPSDASYTAGPYLLGKMSLADVAWYQFFMEFLESDEEKKAAQKAFELAPRFKRAMDAFVACPEVAAWIAKRPKGVF